MIWDDVSDADNCSVVTDMCIECIVNDYAPGDDDDDDDDAQICKARPK